jgi:hypothetical protein
MFGVGERRGRHQKLLIAVPRSISHSHQPVFVATHPGQELATAQNHNQQPIDRSFSQQAGDGAQTQTALTAPRLR